MYSHIMYSTASAPNSVVAAPPVVVSKLELKKAAQEVTTKSLMDLPRLISDRALENAPGNLAKQVATELRSGFMPTVEFVSMPKQGFGNRPLALLSPQARVVLEALVALLQDSLPPSSRHDDFQDFESFGTSFSKSWLVDFDVAACYEFIDHSVLADELILQGADAAVVEVTQKTLSALFGRTIGLPQGVKSSHRLSDAYLDIIERGLARRGYTVRRYADDFRVVAESMKEAFLVVELATDEARRVHLALAEQKIHVRSATEVASEIEERSVLFRDYAKRVYGELTEAVITSAGYDDWDVELVAPGSEKVDFEAAKQLLSDWGGSRGHRSRAMAHAGTLALTSAGKCEDRVPTAILAQIVDREPVRLPKVMEYLLTRDDDEDENWSLLNLISAQSRSTPWHKIWLFSTAGNLRDSTSAEREKFLVFASNQLTDAVEAVRLEAAWLLTISKRLATQDVQDLYARASATSQIGLAAVAGRVSANGDGGAEKAIRDDSALNKCAFKWGQGHVATR